MAVISNVKYLTEESVYEFLHNPNEIYLEGFAVDKEPDSYCPRNCEDGTYIKLFKAPVNSRVTELLMQNLDGAHKKAVTTRHSPKTAQSALSGLDLVSIHPSFGFCRIIFLEFAPN